LESLARSIGGSLRPEPDPNQFGVDRTELVKTDCSRLRDIEVQYAAELDRERQQHRPAFLETWLESLDLARATGDEPAEFRSLREIAQRKGHLSQDDTLAYAQYLYSD